MLRKTCNSILTLLFALLLALPVSGIALAADTSVDLNHKTGSITLMLHEGGGSSAPISGGAFALYRVADAVGRNGGFLCNYTPEFTGCPVSPDALEEEEAAKQLAVYAAKHAKEYAKAGADGSRVAFTGLPLGCYLVVQVGQMPSDDSIAPFLVPIPMRNTAGTGWVYDVDASPKVGPKPEQTSESVSQTVKPDVSEKLTSGGSVSPGPEEPSLIQTGQLNWPIPVLAVAGMLLFALGWALCFHKRSRHEPK